MYLLLVLLKMGISIAILVHQRVHTYVYVYIYSYINIYLEPKWTLWKRPCLEKLKPQKQRTVPGSTHIYNHVEMTQSSTLENFLQKTSKLIPQNQNKKTKKKSQSIHFKKSQSVPFVFRFKWIFIQTCSLQNPFWTPNRLPSDRPKNTNLPAVRLPPKVLVHREVLAHLLLQLWRTWNKFCERSLNQPVWKICSSPLEKDQKPTLNLKCFPGILKEKIFQSLQYLEDHPIE